MTYTHKAATLTSVICIALNFKVGEMAKNLNSVLDELFPFFFLYHQDAIIAFHLLPFPNTIFSVTLYQEIDHINQKSSLTKQHAN